MVDGEAAVELRERCDDQRPDGIAKDVDGDDKRGQLLVCGVEFSHHFRDAGCEHGGCEGPVVLMIV